MLWPECHVSPFLISLEVGEHFFYFSCKILRGLKAAPNLALKCTVSIRRQKGNYLGLCFFSCQENLLSLWKWLRCRLQNGPQSPSCRHSLSPWIVSLTSQEWQGWANPEVFNQNPTMFQDFLRLPCYGNGRFCFTSKNSVKGLHLIKRRVGWLRLQPRQELREQEGWTHPRPEPLTRNE